jgi:bifunctional DNA-binding transcriptional regulator/antitoxin component of YhaV-PrlF toxin-antitoxin module
MKALAITTLSPTGKVTIPEAVSHELGLHSGTQFMVIGHKGTILLKEITQPSPTKNVNALLAKIRKQARSAGIKKSDVKQWITEVRKQK